MAKITLDQHKVILGNCEVLVGRTLPLHGRGRKTLDEGALKECLRVLSNVLECLS